MRYEVAYQPSYSLAIVHLDPREEIRCESGAMVSMSADLVLEAKLNAGSGGGGLLGAAFGAMKKAVLGGESFFITAIRAEGRGGEVALAPAVPGDITAMELRKPLIVQGRSYLASGPGVEVDTKFAGFRGMIGGEGLFFLRVSGGGTVFLTSFGAIHKKVLAAGERYVVDSGHMVAYEEGVEFITRMAAAQEGAGFLKRAATSAASGEGLVMEFTGPGTVWLQTRNPKAFSSWLYNLLPKPEQSQGGLMGAVGGLMSNGEE
jgi:uncharacterized protein (TIGR00266 family)